MGVLRGGTQNCGMSRTFNVPSERREKDRTIEGETRDGENERERSTEIGKTEQTGTERQ